MDSIVGVWRSQAPEITTVAAYLRSHVYDWFGSAFIVRLSLGPAAAPGTFIAVKPIREEPVSQLRLLVHRSFGFGTLANFLLGFSLDASACLLPQYLTMTQGFDAQWSSEVMAWTGIPQLLLIPWVAF